MIETNPSRQKDQVRFNGHFSATMAGQLREIAREEGRSVNDIVRDALKLYFELRSLTQEGVPGVKALDIDVHTTSPEGKNLLVSQKIIF